MPTRSDLDANPGPPPNILKEAPQPPYARPGPRFRSTCPGTSHGYKSCVATKVRKPVLKPSGGARPSRADFDSVDRSWLGQQAPPEESVECDHEGDGQAVH